MYGSVGYVILVAIVGLPTGSLFVLIWRRRALALIPLAISGFVFALWVLYYATDWFSNPGLAGAGPPLLLTGFGWVVLIVAALPRPHWVDEL